MNSIKRFLCSIEYRLKDQKKKNIQKYLKRFRRKSKRQNIYVGVNRIQIFNSDIQTVNILYGYSIPYHTAFIRETDSVPNVNNLGAQLLTESIYNIAA